MRLSTACSANPTGEELLDSYDAERRPWGHDVAEHTLAQTALITAITPAGQALRKLFGDLIGTHPDLELTRRGAGSTSGDQPGGTVALVRPDGHIAWASGDAGPGEAARQAADVLGVRF
ncbi:aromatic-ring hydroxylase C-terminal domain-containing protein [Actinoplanes siamensis]|uniref:FAD binding domain-containing protein n=1 Tax=Actinoplanes siamensis TaxID=1223317 RepID=A0A919N4Y1_9ACTN|nr:hypothetical protein [Actinoplanes siamensis]GIF04489.1 hypothetical protein Asi03nite_20270 [Actinoplanes siamensis]